MEGLQFQAISQVHADLGAKRLADEPICKQCATVQGELRWEPSGPKSNPRWTPPGIEIQHVCGWRCLTFGFQPQFGLKESENPLGNHTITECRSV